MQTDLARRSVAEGVGTAMLLAAVVGSGIMGERLAGGNAAIALLANTVSTGAALVALILAIGPISGAHFNPAVTLVDAWQKGVAWRDVSPMITAQVLGAFVGVASAHVMFGESLFSLSRHARSGAAQMFSEFVATFGLLSVIWGCVRRRLPRRHSPLAPTSPRRTGSPRRHRSRIPPSHWLALSPIRLPASGSSTFRSSSSPKS